MSASYSEYHNRSIQQSENVTRRPSLQAPIECRLCEKIFVDISSLLHHFESHGEEGGFWLTLFSRSLLPLQNGANFPSSSSRFSHSSSDTTNKIGNMTTSSEYLVPHALHNAAPKWKNLAGYNFVPTPSQNSMQLREVVLMRHPSPSSAIRWGIYASRPNRPSTFGEYSNTGDGLNTRAWSCASSFMQSGLPYPVRGKLSISPKYMDWGTAAGDFHLRDYHSPISRLASASQPVQQSKFHSPLSPGTIAPQTLLGTRSALASMTKPLIQLARKNEAESPFTGCTKLHIQQLKQPIEETRMVKHNDSGNNINPDELDLNLKL
ncbi:C2H2-type domain-containing protein [Forsythia ovata]|uniref:C2H2-type domain-containing protein n=1 Tax=Forsythia ovata TaxID=205694 RepID=A0ABD1V1K4_9LAMI